LVLQRYFGFDVKLLRYFPHFNQIYFSRQIFMKVAASRSRANTADRQTDRQRDREKNLTKAIDFALFETTARRLEHNMAVLE